MNHIKEITTLRNYKIRRDEYYDETLKHLGSVFKRGNFYETDTTQREAQKRLPMRRIFTNISPALKEADAAYKKAAWEAWEGRSARRRINRDNITFGLVNAIPGGEHIYAAVEKITDSDAWWALGNKIDDFTRLPNRYITNNVVRFTDFTSYIFRRTVVNLLTDKED